MRFLTLFVTSSVALMAIFVTLGWLDGEPTAVTQAQTSIIAPDLLAKMTESPDTPIRFIATLSDQAAPSPRSSANTTANRANWVAQLQEIAAAAQPSVLQAMRQLEMDNLRSFWIVNSIAGVGTAAAIRQLAARPDIARLDLDASWQAFPSPDQEFGLYLRPTAVAATAAITNPAWGIARIRADKVWQGLGIDGQGVTVAIMDTGVDYLHPDLLPNYRGNLGGGLFDHAGNWYDAVVPTNTTPIDQMGHGTHVAGTAVGQNGIGAAPGANWIAVNIAGPFGLIFTSDARAGFQWLLAPDGDPGLAPDVVNASWSGPPYSPIFVQDVNALRAAGIIPVFAAGNAGPFTGTVGSPASFTDTLAIAASDDRDEIAWFSSRGPSPLTSQPKPTLAAPGAAVASARPNNQYGLSSGTSMAAPHTAGAIALLLSANPALTPAQVTRILTRAAVPLGSPMPNLDSGWGRLDAYAAVSQQVATGALDLRLVGQSIPVANVALTLTTPAAAQTVWQTDEDGRLAIPLPPGSYTITTAPFGYQTAVFNPQIVSGTTSLYTVLLTPLPGGVVSGQVVDEVGQPVTTAVRVLDTPIAAATGSDGRFAIPLPSGVYTLRAGGVGYRLADQPITLGAGAAVTANFTLAHAPTILLVDSGGWYYQSQAAYFTEALTANQLTADLYEIRNPFANLPAAADLSPYDAVMWSAPLDSPGYLGLGTVISDYLDTGGNLFISGQDVGVWDGSGFAELWWYGHLAAQFVGETAVTHTLSGLPATPFDGVQLSLNGGSGADNQRFPDVSRPRAGSLTQPIFQFDDGQFAGLQAGLCQPYRIAYLGFGLEGVAAAGDRADLVDRTIAYFLSPQQTAGVMWTSADVDDFVLAGDDLAYTLTVRNLSETMTDTFAIQTSGGAWATAVTTPSLTLGPCQSAETAIQATVPDTAVRDETNDMGVTAVSGNNPAISATLNLHHKIPGRILLVGDERWYDQRAIYTAALDSLGAPYDLWWTGWNQMGRESPPARILAAYDIILWYIGYDWFKPVTAAENQALADYLAGGGRLFLSSQDFMYYHHQTPLAQQYLGAIAYQESVTPTQAFAGQLSPNLAGPLPFDYLPYQNNGDLLIPGADSQPVLWHEKGVGGIASGGVSAAGENWRAMLWSVPLEKLPAFAHAPALAQILGWLSDLGDSALAASARAAAPGQSLPFTLTIRNDAQAVTNTVYLTNSLPPELALNPATLSGGNYDPASRTLTWQGTLAPGQNVTITYRAVVSATAAPGARLATSARLFYPRHQITFSRTAVLWLNAPDVSGAAINIQADPPQPARRVTATLLIPNAGLATGAVTAVLRLPDALTPLTTTLMTSGGAAVSAGQRLTWTGTIAPGAMVTASIVLTAPAAAETLWLPFTAFVQDGVTTVAVAYEQAGLRPYSHYLPLIAQNGNFRVSSLP